MKSHRNKEQMANRSAVLKSEQNREARSQWMSNTDEFRIDGKR